MLWAIEGANQPIISLNNMQSTEVNFSTLIGRLHELQNASSLDIEKVPLLMYEASMHSNLILVSLFFADHQLSEEMSICSQFQAGQNPGNLAAVAEMHYVI